LDSLEGITGSFATTGSNTFIGNEIISGNVFVSGTVKAWGSGFDFEFVCVEPTPHGIKAAKQIATLLDFFNTPYAFVWNKVRNEKDRELLEDNIKERSFIFTYMDYFSNPEEGIQENEEKELGNMLSYAKSKNEGSSRRYDRTKEKFKRNHTYKVQ
jgi:MinD superfamily P-loop ATPase